MSTIEIRPADLPASPPGRTLRRLLQQQGMSQAELARRMGRPYQIVNDIVNARRSITASTALQLERVLGLPARFWMIREADYRLKLAREAAA